MMFYKHHYFIVNLADFIYFTSKTLQYILFYKTCLVLQNIHVHIAEHIYCTEICRIYNKVMMFVEHHSKNNVFCNILSYIFNCRTCMDSKDSNKKWTPYNLTLDT